MNRVIIVIVILTTLSLGSGPSSGATGPTYAQIKDLFHVDHVIDVRDYGADSTGATECTTGCQAALNAAAGAAVVFPRGTYLTNALSIDDPNTHIIVMSGATVRLLSSATTSLFTVDANDFWLSGPGTLDLNGNSNEVWALIAYPGDDQRQRVTVEGVRIIDGVRGIRTVNYSDVMIRNVRLEATENAPARAFGLGIYCQGYGTTGRQCDVTVTGCHLLGNRDNGDGIVLLLVDHVVIADNLIERWGGYDASPLYSSFCIDTEGDGNDITITGNTIRDPNAGGIAARGAGLVVANNTIEGNVGGACIYIADSNQFECTNNGIRASEHSGIILAATATRGRVSGNIITGIPDSTTKHGIDIYGGTEGIEISANVIVGSGSYSNTPAAIYFQSAADASSPHLADVKANIISGFNNYHPVYGKDLANKSTITGNTIRNCLYGVTLALTTMSSTTGVLVADNAFFDITNQAIVVDSAAINNTLVRGNTDDGGPVDWYAADATDVIVVDGTFTRTVDLTAAQIKGLAGSPIELVPAPGAGRWLELVSARLCLDYGSEALAEPSSPDDLAVEYYSGTGPAVATITANGFVTATVDTVATVPGAALVGTATTTIVNRNLALVNTGDDYTGNASNDTALRIIVTYRIHNNLGF